MHHLVALGVEDAVGTVIVAGSLILSEGRYVAVGSQIQLICRKEHPQKAPVVLNGQGSARLRHVGGLDQLTILFRQIQPGLFVPELQLCHAIGLAGAGDDLRRPVVGGGIAGGHPIGGGIVGGYLRLRHRRNRRQHERRRHQRKQHRKHCDEYDNLFTGHSYHSIHP